ncbi:ManA: mannose-6-phosphate isomerase class I [Desulfosarcina variabilis str. Montpellier]|uniref:mannose-6-phosphate isomerase, class I n=1 Tax=Desulfosarcina variabilis TaxID=2300 RepID=UPI003AFA1CEF
MRIYRLENVIQPYAWGSKTAIAELLGLPGPHDVPQAELWMGTHPKGPSMVRVGAKRVPLYQLIEQNPMVMLGADSVRRFGAVLPYLFKVLAADQPLSIQAHPSKQEAIDGFARENQAGIALDATDRNYRDDNHKPEIICALTPFWALNGFRPAADAVRLMEPVCPDDLKPAFKRLKDNGVDGLNPFFKSMLTLSANERERASAQMLIKAKSLARQSPVYGWMVTLAEWYPADMGILSPALLNLIRLSPRQAMYLPAGQLHAYLDGVGIELMANSDNVLRGGLTPKHVDVPELLRVVRFGETTITPLDATPMETGECCYRCPAEEFSLSMIEVDPSRSYASPSARSIEILLCTEGKGRIAADTNDALSIKKGDSLVVPAALDRYTIDGYVTIYKASVPLPIQ